MKKTQVMVISKLENFHFTKETFVNYNDSLVSCDAWKLQLLPPHLSEAFLKYFNIVLPTSFSLVLKLVLVSTAPETKVVYENPDV